MIFTHSHNGTRLIVFWSVRLSLCEMPCFLLAKTESNQIYNPDRCPTVPLGDFNGQVFSTQKPRGRL